MITAIGKAFVPVAVITLLFCHTTSEIAKFWADIAKINLAINLTLICFALTIFQNVIKCKEKA